MISPPIWVLIAFFLGAIPFALLLAHLSGKGDVRPVGDGNPGVTNTWKLGGWRLGAPVLALDFSEGALPVAAASIFVARSVIQSNIISLVAEILFGVVLVL